LEELRPRLLKPSVAADISAPSRLAYFLPQMAVNLLEKMQAVPDYLKPNRTNAVFFGSSVALHVFITRRIGEGIRER
jgi:hypothetical protein